jgi:hypothetical protein
MIKMQGHAANTEKGSSWRQNSKYLLTFEWKALWDDIVIWGNVVSLAAYGRTTTERAQCVSSVSRSRSSAIAKQVHRYALVHR